MFLQGSTGFKCTYKQTKRVHLQVKSQPIKMVMILLVNILIGKNDNQPHYNYILL